MTISDNRFGAQLITPKGKIFSFDDIHCLQSYMNAEAATLSGKEHIYFTNFCSDHALIASHDAFLLKSTELKSPMGGNIAAFNKQDSLQKMKDFYQGTTISWIDIRPK
jgi:copper chaperone NosL